MIFSTSIDLDTLIPGSQHFKWREALWLREWNFAAFPTLEQMNNIVGVAAKMEIIRAFLGNPSITVTSWLRPQIYNQHIGGATASEHPMGAAVDFQVQGKAPNDVRALLVPKLVEFGIRMENLPSSTWTHIDTKIVGPGMHNFFIP